MPGFTPFIHRLSPEDTDYLRTLYHDEVQYMDDAIGRLTERLDSLGLSSDTLVVLTSDHGEEFYEHGGFFHSHTLYEELIRVPLLLSGPGVAPGRRSSEVVEIRQLLRSLENFITAPDSNPLKHLEAASGRAYAEHVFYGEARRALVEARYKLIERQATGRLELYDLARDPGERHNLAAARPDLAARMRDDMRALERENQALASRLGNTPAPSTVGSVTEEALEQLRSLGYIN